MDDCSGYVKIVWHLQRYEIKKTEDKKQKPCMMYILLKKKSGISLQNAIVF